jgi:hypothetical protein
LENQRLLNQAAWDQDAVRDRLVSCVAAELSDPSGILIVDLCRPAKP